MSGQEESPLHVLGDVASWVRDFELDGGQALVELLPTLDSDESIAAILQLVVLCSAALQGTGGRGPAEWLTSIIEESRRQSPDV